MRQSCLAALTAAILSLLCACGSRSGTTTTSQPSTPPSSPVTGTTANIDFSTTHQTIRGFGGSTAWMPPMPSAEVNALFGTGTNQIGLSILRVRIDPSSVSGGTNWDTEVTNAQEAIAAGSNVSVIATPWTPPASMKSNNNVVMGSLNPTSYGAYATYLESFVNYMASRGVNLYGISMQNEPDANVTYESCVWTPAQMDQWAANSSSVLTTKLIMPESQNFLTSYSDPALNDPLAAANIGIIGGHIYGVSPAPYPSAVNAGKELWMTEHYLDPAASQPSIGDALKAAKEIHDSLTIANYNAYLWWWVADWNPGAGVTNTGLVDTTNTPTYFGWALAQYARFVRPGYVRVDTTNNTPSVYVSAYKGNGHSVIVAVNLGTSDVSQPFAIQNQTISSVVPYQTTATTQVAQQSAVAVSGNQFTYTLPAQSITTFVQ